MDTGQPSMSTTQKGDAIYETTSKKGTLENLSQEELVKKCSNLLAWAHKAKIAKDKYVEENRQLKEKISKFETQKDADKKSLMAMNEMLEALTENKLELITKLENLESRNHTLDAESKKNGEVMVALDIENESLKRQLKRVSDENDALSADLDNLESKLEKVNNFGVQQQKDLVLLEEAADKWKQFENKAKELKIQLDASNSKYDLLKNTSTIDKTELENKLKNLQEIIVTKSDRIDRFKSRLLDVSRKLKKLNDCKRILLETQHDYAKSITKWQMEIIDASKHLYCHMEKLETENKILNNKVNCDKSLNDTDSLVKKIDILETNCFEMSKKHEKCSSCLEKIQAEYKTQSEQFEANEIKLNKCEVSLNLLQDDYDQLKSKYTLSLADIESLQKIQTDYGKQTELFNSVQLENKQLQEKNLTSSDNSPFHQEVKNLKDLVHQKSVQIKELEVTVANKDSKNKELLTEMREINEALKGRGDLISRQQHKLNELETEVKQTSENLIKIENNLTTKDSLISEKEFQISKMNEEISIAKSQVESLSQQSITNEKLIKNFTDEMAFSKSKNSDALETQSETMSTSTISRVEELNRLREVDDSLEDKYVKLRSLAIKLKKKVQEQAAQLSSYENDNKKPESVLQVKNLKILQNENDKLLDELENYKKLYQEKSECLAELAERFENLSKKHEDEKLKQDVNASQNCILIKDYEKEIKLLKQEKDNLTIARKEIEKELEILKKSLVAKQDELVSLTKQFNKTKVDLDKSRAAGKQSNVLNLEIADFEKSLNETTEKLSIKVSQLKESEIIIANKDYKIDSLNKQITLLEDNLNSEKAHSLEQKKQLDIHQDKQKKTENDKKELISQVNDLKIECETCRLEIRTLQLQISETANANEKLNVTLQIENDKLMRQVLELEGIKENLIEQMQTTQRSLDDLQSDYINYKAKAQSVLRQNQTKESSRERELEEELTSAQSQIQKLNARIESYIENVGDNERKLDSLREENKRIQKRCKELIELLEESRLQNDLLLDDNRKLNVTFQESLKNHRLQIETINLCYKKQLQEVEKKHSDLIEKSNISNQSQEVKPALRANPYGGSKSIDEQKIELILMEREDAEGSETSMSMPRRKSLINIRSKHDLIPLDELLNSSIEDNFHETADDDDHHETISSNDRQTTINRLQAQESRIRHLTSLLSETEQDLTKHIQLNELLKEEVRRHERSMEREKHMHNSEYLKNIVLKFITLNSGDERARLIPVMNTILKLSPDEVSALQLVAKGKATDSQNRSWSNFLHTWSNNNQ